MSEAQGLLLSEGQKAMLQEGFNALKPQEKGRYVSKIFSDATVTVGFDAVEPDGRKTSALPLTHIRENPYKTRPPGVSERLLEVLPHKHFRYLEGPEHIKDGMGGGVEWYPFVRAEIAAIPQDQLVADLSAYIDSLYKDSKKAAAIKHSAFSTIASGVQDMGEEEWQASALVPLEGKMEGAFYRALTEPEFSKDRAADSEIAHSLKAFMFLYLGNVGVGKDGATVKISPERVKAFRENLKNVNATQ